MKKNRGKYFLIFIVIVTLLVLSAVFYSQTKNLYIQLPAKELVQTGEEMAADENNTVTDTQENELKNVNKGEINLQIQNPADGATVQSDTLLLRGLTSPDIDVFINDAETRSDQTGIFSQELKLEEGENIISVTAVDGEGNYAEQEIGINFSVNE